MHIVNRSYHLDNCLFANSDAQQPTAPLHIIKKMTPEQRDCVKTLRKRRATKHAIATKNANSTTPTGRNTSSASTSTADSDEQPTRQSPPMHRLAGRSHYGRHPRNYHATEHPRNNKAINASLDSIRHVAVYLQKLNQPLILVGKAPMKVMNVPWLDYHIIDILVEESVCSGLVEYLTEEHKTWWQPDSDLDMIRDTTHTLRAGRGMGWPKKLDQLKRDAVALLQRRCGGPDTCSFLRIWTPETYHLEINDTNITLMRPDRSIWAAGGDYAESFKNPDIELANSFFIPTFRAHMDTLLYQAGYRGGHQDYLSEDATVRINKLITWNHLDQSPARELIIQDTTCKYRNYILMHNLDHFYKRPEPWDKWDARRKEKNGEISLGTAKAEQTRRFRDMGR
ncbi:hypothetical protein BJ170DRAFT_595353 [Xylariales sp. AK1849]|nr:hypothetical protein BJ170DRAFT_595353 [Xylariales sp. AK1849]